MIQPLPVATYKEVADQNWMEAWKQYYKPILIGERLVIVPAWMESPDSKRIAIKIDPGMAFGTGLHPSTRLCVERLEAWADTGLLRGARVLDVGSGSGTGSGSNPWNRSVGGSSGSGPDSRPAWACASRSSAEPSRCAGALFRCLLRGLAGRCL